MDIKEQLVEVRAYLDQELHPLVSPDHWDIYSNLCDMIDNISILLEEQKPRLLTLEEVKTYPTNKALWFEGKTIIPVLPDCRAEQRYENQLGVEVIDTFYDFPLWFDSYNIPYKYGWRCWSARPTDEQREAVKWDD